jgi:signal transduction histidine kinase
MLRRYKEILGGFGLGLAMWVVDAVMHVVIGADVHSSGSFAVELLQPGFTQLIFRSAFLFVGTAFGWALWRSNWRERELRALEDAIVAFHRQLDSPAMRIVNHVRMLQGRAGITRDEVACDVIEAIGEDARSINALAQQYMRFSEQVMAGRTHEAIETLRAIEAWSGNQNPATSPQLSPPPAP